jgi:outer membrane protein assembly factor BamA
VKSLTGRAIDVISIQNSRGRTRDAFVRAKLRLSEGASFDPVALDEGVSRLQETRIFSGVSATASEKQGKLHIEVQLEEKWTTLPDLRFGGGGGTAFFRLGVFDINWLGLGVQSLVAYENRNGTNNGDAWVRYPQAFGTENLIGGGLSRTTTLLTDYGAKGEVLGGQAMSKTTFLLDYERELAPNLKFGYRMEPEWVSFNDYQIATNVKEANDIRGSAPSPATQRVLHRTQLVYSTLRFEGVRTNGIEVIVQMLPAFRDFGSDYTVLMSRHDVRYFRIMPFGLNLASRLTFKTSNNSRPENIHRVGGLTEVRGYFDGEFAGRYNLFSSLEIRKNVLTTWSFVWQPAVFYDWGLVSGNFDDLWQQKLRDAIGLGLRLAPDFVHLATFRLDYAWGLSDSRNAGGISFGILHFF